MYTVNDTTYVNKFNEKKIKTIEAMAKVPLIAELTKNNGILQLQVLELLFSLSLVEEATNEVVKQSTATEIFNTLIREQGFLTINQLVVEKLYSDLGFMFR